jgi:hypothetical protein
LDIEDQERVILEEYHKGWALRAEQEPEDEIIQSGVNPDNIRKWKVLQSVQDRNETLFYRCGKVAFETQSFSCKCNLVLLNPGS